MTNQDVEQAASQYDPWLAPPDSAGGQSGRTKAYCQIFVSDGTEWIDITNRLNPYLISVDVHDGYAGEQGFFCDIELDDRDARLPIPPWGSPVMVILGWVGGASRLWIFTISDVVSSFQRAGGSGRHLTVHCIGANTQFMQLQTLMQSHWGEGAPPGMEIGLPVSFGEVASDVAGYAGATAAVHPALAALTRDYWQMANESPGHWFQRHANELGAVTRVQNGNQVVMTLPGSNPDGSSTTTVMAVWGVNLIAWRLRPWVARSTWMASYQQWYDTIAGALMSGTVNFGFPAPWGSGSEQAMPAAPAPNSQVGDQQNQGAKLYGLHGEGRITINGEPAAQWMGHVIVQGARPGVNGQWIIYEAEHTYSRAGYVTYLTVRPDYGAQPANSVATDYPQPASSTPTGAPSMDQYNQIANGVTFTPDPAPNYH